MENPKSAPALYTNDDFLPQTATPRPSIAAHRSPSRPLREVEAAMDLTGEATASGGVAVASPSPIWKESRRDGRIPTKATFA